jgi:hypothetical protein
MKHQAFFFGTKVDFNHVQKQTANVNEKKKELASYAFNAVFENQKCECHISKKKKKETHRSNYRSPFFLYMITP